MLAFSDGVKGDGYPQLLPRPIAFSLFTLRGRYHQLEGVGWE